MSVRVHVMASPLCTITGAQEAFTEALVLVNRTRTTFQLPMWGCTISMDRIHVISAEEHVADAVRLLQGKHMVDPDTTVIVPNRHATHAAAPVLDTSCRPQGVGASDPPGQYDPAGHTNVLPFTNPLLGQKHPGGQG